jgi:hypothetical protein
MGFLYRILGAQEGVATGTLCPSHPRPFSSSIRINIVALQYSKIGQDAPETWVMGYVREIRARALAHICD